MLSSTQLIGIVVCILATIVVAAIVMRLDDAIVAPHTIGEEEEVELPPAAGIAHPQPPYLPARKKRSRRQRTTRICS